MTREEWLNAVSAKLAPLFIEAGARIPSNVRISVGWPSVKALTGRNRRIGECWSDKASADGTFEIFISPSVGTGLEAAAILVHELVHAAVGLACGHKGPFRRVALAVGLMGKMTATTAGPALVIRLNAIIAEVGPYPHAKLDMSQRKKQGTRMVKLECDGGCGYAVRTTQKWIDVGLPTCPCGGTLRVSL